MNKRIARKILSTRQKLRRRDLWRRGYGPDSWPIEQRARAYLDRRSGRPFNRTMRILRCGGWFARPPVSASSTVPPPTESQIHGLVAAWRAHRPFLWRAIRGGQRHRDGSRIPGETIEEGRAVGDREVAGWVVRGENPAEAVLYSLDYFSDRWCISRIGRMDAYMEALDGSAGSARCRTA